MLNRPLPAPARDVAILVGRVILGVVLFAHGWQKLMINGIAGTYGQFERLGIPLAIVSASFASFVEFVGGALIILGALTSVVVALDLVVMVGAAGFVHFTHGIFAQDGGWELVGVIVAAELALVAFGPGRFSVDHLVTRLRQREQEDLHRRMQKPVRRPATTSETFIPAVETSAARSYATGGFAAVGQAAAARTDGFAAVAPIGGSAQQASDVVTGAFPVTAPGPMPAGAFAEANPTAGAATTALTATRGAAGGFGATSFASASTGSIFATVPPTARTATPAASTASLPAAPEVRALAVDAATPAPATTRHTTATPPRMASAGVHRVMSERAGRSAGEETGPAGVPAPFGVTVQSPLDFTPTAAFPAVPPSSVTEMIAVATPAGLPRRVRPTPDLPPASAVRPYA